MFTITARLKKGFTIEQVRDSIYSQLDELRSILASPDELERVRNNLRAHLVFDLDRPSRVAGTLGFNYIVAGDFNAAARLYDVYGTISAEKLRTVATETFDKLNRTVVTLVPKSGI